MSTKRRRERDRPKAGPDAAYDPNKRVLLSYGDSDGEEDAQQELALDPRAYAPAKSYALEPEALYNIQDAVHCATERVEDLNHDNTNLPNAEGDDDEYDPEEAFPEEAIPEEPELDYDETPSEKTNAHPRKNNVTMQKPALGSLSYQWDEDDEEDGYGAGEDEAMAYLRAVRQERQSMPSVFRVVDTTKDADYETGDSRGYYDEDCYIARPIYAPRAPAKTTIAPREAYTSALKARFMKLHHRLRQPPEPLGPTDASGQPFVPEPQAGNSAYADCLKCMQQAPPAPVHLQPMSQDSVFATLELIDKHFIQRSQVIDRNTSAWIFALLARLDEVGSMDHDKVSILREMGKRAVIVQISFKDAMTAAQLEGLGDDDNEGQDTLEGQVQPANAESSHEPNVTVNTTDDAGATEAETSATTDKENTLATLDMILAVVGEIFGQRDLLEFRRSWEPDG